MNLSGFTYFYPEKPRLARVDMPLVETLERAGWVAEPKYNGMRLVLYHLPSGEFQFWGRHGEKLVYSPSSELLEALRGLRLTGLWAFDGELRHNKVSGIRHRVVLYDLLICGGELLTGKTFADRRGVLDMLFHYHGSYDLDLELAPQYPGDFRGTYERLIQDPEIEGLVLKNPKGRLNLGRTSAVDSNWMFKLRRPSGRYHF